MSGNTVTFSHAPWNFSRVHPASDAGKGHNKAPLKCFTDNAKGRICVLYTAIVSTLLIMLPVFGYFSYTVLYENEHRTYQELFESLSDDIFTEISVTTTRLQAGANAFASYVEITSPDAANWPNVSIDHYGLLNGDMGLVSGVTFALAPIVHPHEIEGFEEHSKTVFASTPGVPPGSGESDFGYGIFTFDENGDRYHDTTGSFEHSAYRFTTPLLYSGFPERTKAFLYNIHSSPVRAQAMDASYECAMEGGVERGYCSALTDIVQHISDENYRPNTLLIKPVYPSNNRSQISGFLIGGFNWDTILENALSSTADEVECVIQSPQRAYTFLVGNGKSKLKGSGDLHDSTYSDAVKSIDIKLANAAADSVVYTISIYPTQSFYDSYHSDLPIIWTVSGLLLTIVITMLFIFYDRVVKADSNATTFTLQQKRRFVRLVSHEIRTPLNTVKMGLRLQEELLRAEDATKEQCRTCTEIVQLTSEIQASSEVALLVLNDLLQYDKIEVGQLNIEVAVVQFWKTIKDVVLSFKIDAANKGVTLALEFDIDNAHNSADRQDTLSRLYTMGDSIRLSQIVRNLLSNALKFSSHNSTIFITAIWVEHGLPSALVLEPKDKTLSAMVVGNNPQRHGSILLSVRDEGPGISQENQKKLFGEGQQFDANELQGGQGSGLGLFIAKGLVDMHQGKIWAESENEGTKTGTIFYVELPTVKGERPINETAKRLFDSVPTSTVPPSNALIIPAATSDETMPLNRFEPMEQKLSKVLVADDSLSNRKMLCRLLTMRGYECHAVDDGQKCVDAILATGGHDFICVILDNHMPIMNGPDAVRIIRDNNHNLPVFGLTGSVMKDDVEHFIKCGANYIFEKPLDIDLFDAKMLEYL